MASCQRDFGSLHPKDKKLVRKAAHKKRCRLKDEDFPRDVIIRVPSVRRGKGSVVVPVTLLPDKIVNMRGDQIL